MHTEVVEELEECKALWDAFSPKKTIWDLWETVISFYDESLHKPKFLVLSENKEEKGMLPLWEEKKTREHYFFGGGFPENRKFWFDPSLFPHFLRHLPDSTVLYDINEHAVEKTLEENPGFKDLFSQNDFRYIVDLQAFNNSLKIYLNTFSKKHRKNFLYDLRKLKDLNYKISWETTEHFDDFADFSIQRFGKDSDLSNPGFAQSMLSFLSFLDNHKILHTCSVVIDGKVMGIEFAAFHNGVYYVLNGGHSKDFSNLGKLLIWEQMKKAVELKAAKVDFLAGNSGWKELWNCEKQPYYCLKK